MEIKTLNWRNNITKNQEWPWTLTTEITHPDNLFEILADVEELDLHYSIRNYKQWGDKIQNDKFYLLSGNFEIKECNSVEIAKLEAQENFKRTVLNLFFE